MFFHFQPVSFSLEAPPCRSPCPLATDVLSGGGGREGKWSCFADQLSVVRSPTAPPSLSRRFFLFFFYFRLEPGCQEKEEKKGSEGGEKKKSTERLNQIQ